MAFAACLAWGNSVEAGTAVNWAGGTGMWSDPSAWDLTLVPNNNGDTYDVAIGSPVDDVSLDLSVTVDTVANAGTLRFLDGFSLTLAQPGGLTNTGQVLIDHSGTSGLFGAFNNEGFAWIKSGTLELNSDVNNTGTMWLGDGSYAGGTCEIQALDDLSFTGSGELYFYSSSMTQADQPLLNIPLGVTVTNGPDHRIHGGSGRIEGAGSFINQGMIDADAPLRTLTLDMDQFVNEGELFARSGNLDVNVDNWHNSGAILIANGSNSTFTGSQFTNDSGGVIESVGGAELSLSQNVTNFGLMSADSSGQITFSGSSALVINASGGVIDATAGTVRFEATSGYIQNFGVMQADEGVFEFANGVDVFGGSLGLSNHGLATVMTGTTTLTQVHTTLDSTSSLGVEDKGTGTATLTFDGILENSGGTLKAVSEAVGTTTFNLYGNIFDDGGTILSDGGDFNVSNATWVEAGVLSFDIRNAGEISFTNTDSTASQIDVSWAGTGGELVFNNYRKQGTPTHLDLSGWSADGGDFTVSGGSVLTGSGQAMLPADTTLTVTGAGSSLSLSGLTQSAAGSLIDLVSGGALVASNLAVDGDFSFRGGTFDGSLVLNPSAGFTVTSSTNWVTGDFSWVGDRDVEITGSSAALGVDGSMPVASGSSVRLIHNATRLNGAGVATNSGVIEGGAPSNSNWTYMDLDLVNNADGVVRAFQNGTATNTRFQLSSDITNAGLMEAKGANLYFSGANVQNSGTFQAVDHADGSKLVFLNNTTVTDLGGTTLIDGANSRLEVSGGADVALGTLSFTNGATGFVSGTNSALSASNLVDIAAGIQFQVASGARLNLPAGLNLDGELLVQSGGTVDAPITVNPTGQITVNSGTTTLDGGSVDLLNNGRLAIVGNSTRVNGTALIDNSGMIEGGATSSSNWTYLDNDVVNNADGVIRAFQNGTPTSTYFGLTGDITNAGLMKADGARLYLNGANITNSGMFEAVDNVAASRLQFLGSTVVTDDGGTTLVNGELSTVEVSGSANVDLGTLSLTNNATGYVSGSGSVLSADTSIGVGSVFSVKSSGRLSGLGVQLDGELILQSATVVDAAVTVNPTGQITANSGTTTIDAPVNVLSDGAISIVANNARVNGTGVITNSGVIEGGATSNSYATYLDNDVVNNADGVIRAFQNGTPTSTYFALSGDITNAGLMKADGARLYLNGANITNSGTFQAVDNVAGSRLQFLGSTIVTDDGGTTLIEGALSTLEVSGSANVDLGALWFTNNATGYVSGNGSVLSADTTIGAGSFFEVENSALLSGTGVQVDGTMEVYNARVDAPVTIADGGEVFSTRQSSSYPARFDGSVTVESGGTLSMYLNNTAVSGDGVITNHGLVRGAAASNSGVTYFYSEVANASDGVIRAEQNVSGATNTRLEIYGPITNEGVMEADGGNLRFTSGSTVDNSGVLRAVNGNEIRFQSGATVTDAGGSLSLSSGGTGYITGSNTVVNADTTVAEGSMLDLRDLAVLGGPGAQIDGTMQIYNATVAGPLTISATGEVFSTYLNSSYPARFNGPVTIDNGGTLSMWVYRAAVDGDGLITNHGLIQGGSNHSSYLQTYLYSEVANASDGVIRAAENNGVTNSQLEIHDHITNEGLAEANGGNLRFMGGSSVTNSGVLQAVAGNEIRFQSGATVTDAGGGILSLSGAGTGYITDSGTIVEAQTNVADGSTLYLRNSAVLGGSGVQLDGTMEVYNATVAAPLTIADGGEVFSTYQSSSYRARFDGPVTIDNGGTLSMWVYRATVDGDGLITNHGLIQGGSNHSSYPETYLYSEVANASDGVIRAAENNGVTTSRLQVYDHITNAGLAEANGGNLWFMGGSSVTNSGVLQAVNGNEIRFQSGATVTDAGGGILSLSDAGTGYITDSGTIVEAQTNVAESSTLYLRNSAVLDGVGVQLDGTMEVYNATVAAPLTISATGEAISTYQSSSSPARFNSPVTIESGGKLSMYNYWSAVDGDGLITNHGLIQGASNNSSYQTYLYSEVANASDGVIRAAENNGITTSRLEIYDHITNAGLVEANGGNLRFMGDSSVTNSGVLQAVAGNEIRFQSGATVTDAGGGTLSLSDGGTGYITDSGTIVEAQTNVADGSTLYLRNSAVLDGVGVQLDGVMEVYNATVAAPLTISATGEAIPTSTYSSPARFDGSVTIENGGKLSMYNNSSATSGEGLITNHGLIQGAAVSNGNWTYLYSDVLNEADGVIRAARNDIAMNTGLYVYGDITNAGAMEADGGTLYLTGATVANSGIIRATNDSQVTFISGTVVSDSGGTLRIEPTGTGLISGSGTQVEATTVVDDGGALTLTSSALLLGPSVQVDGDMYVQSSRVDAPVTVGLTGNVIANSSTATFDKAITVLGDGVTAGALSVVGNSDRISGLGDIENFGLIEGGAPSNSYTTYLDNEVVNRSTGTIRAFSNGGATNTTFAINGNIVNEGLMEADGATLSMSGITVDNTAGSWSAVNGGRLLVSGSFVGGASGSNTTIDGDTSSLELTNGSLVGFDSLTLTNGGDVSVSGTNTSLFVLSPFTIPDGSVATVASSGRLQAGGITVDGTLAGQGGTVISDVHLNAPGLIDATSGSTIIEGDVTTTAGSLISVTNSSTGLVVNGTLDNAAGATVRLNSNTTALSGDGLFTNAGLLEGGAFNNNNTVTMSKVFSNSGDVVATSASAATGTTFQITSPTIGNTGTMTATDAHLTISGSQMTHSGTMRAENGNRLRFQSSATVGDVGGSFGGVEIDGDASLLDVLSSSSVSLGSLSLTDGGDASVTGSASLDVMAPFTVGVGSELTVSGWGMLSGGGVQVDNLMYAGASTITAPTTIGPTGELFITSSSGAMFDAPITVQNDSGGNYGRISLLGNSYLLRGSGTITNSGVIEGGAGSNNYNTYIDNTLVNNTDGVVRAIQNGAATNTNLRIRGHLTNNGLMEAYGANLYFTGTTGQHGGIMRAVDHANGSKLIFLGGATLTDTGGVTEVDGSLSQLQVSGGANVGLGTLSLTNGATGYVTGSGSAVSGDTTIGAGSLFQVQNSSVLGGVGARVDGTMEVYNATVNAPLTISAGGEVLSTRQSSSYPARFDAPVTIDNGGKLSMNLYRTVVSGNGVITNHGLIQGASNNASYPTYLYNTVANASDGVVRAAANGGVTTAWFQLYGNMTNEGVMEADGGNLRFMSGSTVSNSGTLRALNGNEIRFQDGATVTDAGGGMLSLSGGGTGTITGSGTVVASGVSVAAGSTLYVQSSSQLHVSAGGMTNDGTVEVSGGSTFIADGPVVSGAGSTLSYASGSLLDFNGSLTVDGVLDMANNMLPIDGDLSFGANGALRAASGGSILLSGNFSNASTLNGDFDSLDLSLNLTANGNELDPLLFEIGGEDIDALMAGLTDNFAVGELLILGVDEFVQLMDVFDNALDGASNDALYVGALTITDLDSRLILNGVNVYYGTFTAPGGLSQIDMSGGGSFTALPGLLAPEPTTAWLLMLGGAWILGGRRRRSH